MNILVLGGDKRYDELVKELKKSNVVDRNYSDISKYNIIIFPIGGVSDDYFIKTLNGNKKISKDLLKDTRSDVVIYTGLITNRLKEIAGSRKIVSLLDDKCVKKEN